MAPSTPNLDWPDLSMVKASENKELLRRSYLGRRDSLLLGDRVKISSQISDNTFNFLKQRGRGVVAGYWPVKSEVNILPLLEKWQVAGGEAALPVVVERNSPLSFYLWTPETPMRDSDWGIKEPDVGKDQAVVPDIVLVPLVAFDRQGRRLGYGGGYYDRTLRELSCIKSFITIGMGYASQECEMIPAEDHDVTLDYIVTEKEVYRVTK